MEKLTDGLHGAEMFVIAARPSMGKTAFAMNMAEHIAVELGHMPLTNACRQRHFPDHRTVADRARSPAA